MEGASAICPHPWALLVQLSAPDSGHHHQPWLAPVFVASVVAVAADIADYIVAATADFVVVAADSAAAADFAVADTVAAVVDTSAVVAAAGSTEAVAAG